VIELATPFRNAIEHLLQRPPVQGKAALERLEKEIQSEYFPTIPENAVNYFKNGPLSRPRDSLVRNFVLVILKSLLLGELDEQSERRYEGALQAIRIMQREIVEATFKERLNDLMLRVADDQLFRCLRIFSNISDTWQYLRDDSKKRLQNYVIALPDEMIGRMFVYVFSFPPFQDDEAFRSGVIEKIVSKYEDVSSFYEANDDGIYMVVPSVRYLKAVHVSKIIRASAHNRQIASSYQRDNVLNVVRSADVISTDDFDKLLAENGLTL
jgi:hypothetical protein